MTGRGIDHLVLAVRDLGEGAALYERMGFTLTPEAQHPFGTGNRLAQLQGCFIEVLGVTRPELITEAGPGEFSFGAYNRDFLANREGMSMIAFESYGPERDRSHFEAAGFEPAAPFSFVRMALQPDGSEVEMGFDLTFVPRPEAPAAAVFTCSHRHRPEQFYKAAYQTHANTAQRIDAVTIETGDPDGTREFLTEFNAGPKMFDVVAAEVAGERLAGYAVTVEDMDAARRALRAGDVAFAEDGDELTVGPEHGLGTRITFCKESKS
jgi:hypothetical protein